MNIPSTDNKAMSVDWPTYLTFSIKYQVYKIIIVKFLKLVLTLISLFFFRLMLPVKQFG